MFYPLIWKIFSIDYFLIFLALLFLEVFLFYLQNNTRKQEKKIILREYTKYI